MALFKALLLGALVTAAFFLFVVWILPILTFLAIFAGVTIVAYGVMKADQQRNRDPP
ncbi:hypothetical protein [Brucella anthropi]|uniref:Uncharacterized protein n=1 Tax=Brucella anthropi TaxID=529 RepID=A0A8I0N9R4_BRUAN|nr:hypothetical protein [Brucella anthropi]MBE0563645.1 hypothetical protein [Brucella anthropi]